MGPGRRQNSRNSVIPFLALCFFVCFLRGGWGGGGAPPLLRMKMIPAPSLLYLYSLFFPLALVVCPFFLFVDNPKGAAADAAGMGSPPPPRRGEARYCGDGRCAGGCCRRFPSGTVRRYSIK